MARSLGILLSCCFASASYGERYRVRPSQVMARQGEMEGRAQRSRVGAEATRGVRRAVRVGRLSGSGTWRFEADRTHRIGAEGWEQGIDRHESMTVTPLDVQGTFRSSSLTYSEMGGERGNPKFRVLTGARSRIRADGAQSTHVASSTLDANQKSAVSSASVVRQKDGRSNSRVYTSSERTGLLGKTITKTRVDVQVDANKGTRRDRIRTAVRRQVGKVPVIVDRQDTGWRESPLP